jgi:hypothetical protein
MSDGTGKSPLLDLLDFDRGSGHDYHPGIGLYLPKDGGHVLVSESEGLPQIPTRQSGYIASEFGRRFVATHQTLGGVTVGRTALSATTPTWMIRNNGASKKVILRSMDLTEKDTGGAGGTVDVIVVIDTADRYSAGGTPHTPQNVNAQSGVASGISNFYATPTASAAGGGTRIVYSKAIPAEDGAGLSVEFEDSIIIGTTGTILIYDNSNGTGVEWYWNFEWEEIS